jgi:hypothetical protein
MTAEETRRKRLELERRSMVAEAEKAYSTGNYLRAAGAYKAAEDAARELSATVAVRQLELQVEIAVLAYEVSKRVPPRPVPASSSRVMSPSSSVDVEVR